MGFYYGSTCPPFWSGDVLPTITPREYIDLLSRATGLVMSSAPEGSDTCRRLNAREAVPISILIKGLRRRLHERPADATTNRMLAIAELRAGNCKAAIRHLAIAVNLLLTPTRHECLQRSLHTRVELALLLPVVIPLCLRLGRHTLARRAVDLLLARVVAG